LKKYAAVQRVSAGSVGLQDNWWLLAVR